MVEVTLVLIFLKLCILRVLSLCLYYFVEESTLSIGYYVVNVFVVCEFRVEGETQGCVCMSGALLLICKSSVMFCRIKSEECTSSFVELSVRLCRLSSWYLCIRA